MVNLGVAVGSAVPVLVAGFAIYYLGKKRSWWRSFVYAGWVALALYGLGARQDYNLASAGIYGLWAALFVVIGAFADKGKARAAAQDSGLD